MKNKLIAIGCGLLLGLGVATTSYVSSTQKESTYPKIFTQEEEMILTHLTYASKFIKEGMRSYALWHLDHLLDKNEGLKIGATLEQVVKETERVVDKYIKNEKFNIPLLILAKTLYEKQKIETARHNLQEMLEAIDKKYGSPKVTSHMWMIYNITLRETNSVEKTHKEVKEYFKKVYPIRYPVMNDMLDYVESKIPKGDSELIKKIKNYNKIIMFGEKHL